MSDILTKYQRFKKKLDRHNRTRDQKIGALNQILERLKEEHNCNDLDEAKAKHKEIKRERQRKEEELTTKFKSFERKYRSLFENVSQTTESVD